MRKSKYPKLQDAEWLGAELKVKSIKRIAEELGTTPGNVASHAKLRGVLPIYASKSEAVKAALKKTYPNGAFGRNANHWKGGRHLQQNGYVLVHAPTHPRAGKRNRVYEHILVAEEKLGRYIGKDEIVHHINGKKDDNRPENLEVYKRTEHYHHHMTSGKSLQKLHKHIEYLQNLLTENNIEY